VATTSDGYLSKISVHLDNAEKQRTWRSLGPQPEVARNGIPSGRIANPSGKNSRTADVGILTCFYPRSPSCDD
jgi:hypothetical protein